MLEQYPDILRVEEAAEILRVSKRAIYQYAADGILKSFSPIGANGREVRRILIPKQALIDYLEGCVNGKIRDKGFWKQGIFHKRHGEG
jgi:excisionase family DNA binding protein